MGRERKLSPPYHLLLMIYKLEIRPNKKLTYFRLNSRTSKKENHQKES